MNVNQPIDSVGLRLGILWGRWHLGGMKSRQNVFQAKNESMTSTIDLIKVELVRSTA